MQVAAQLIEDFESEHRILGWRFEEYRNNARYRGIPTPVYIADNRDAWRNRGPLRGRPRLGHPRPESFVSVLLRRNLANGSLDEATPIGAPARYIQAKDWLRYMRETFSNQPSWHYHRALGFGGGGIAIKYSYRPQGQPAFDFVLKVEINQLNSENIRAEENATRKMSRAAHCVQLIPRSRLGLPPQAPYRFEVPQLDDSSESAVSSGEESRDDRPNAAYRDRRTRRQRMANVAAAQQKAQDHQDRIGAAEALHTERELLVQAEVMRLDEPHPPPQPPDTHDIYRHDILLTEFCEHGDLQNLLYKLNEKNKKVPNRVLWGFWLCLVRACVAMQYPPRKFHLKRRANAPADVNAQPGVDISAEGKVVGTDLYEDIPSARRRWAMKRFVHFDIDAKNIFICGLDVNARDEEHRYVPRLKLGDFGLSEEIKPYKKNAYYVSRRDVAKWGYYAPEQFGIDWDHIAKPDGTAISALGPEISEQPIAGNYGPHTNVWGIAMLQRAARGSNISAHYCPLLLTDDAYAWVDIELRETIARCMAHDPKNRPRPATLLTAAKRGIQKRFGTETNNFIREWVQDMIFDP